jgi:glycosyltransferase involved in cell wall biosynthesis
MDLSVIICTYNRADMLEGCLECLASQQGVEQLDWEVVVVDNNCTDGTPALVDRLSRRLPIRLRSVREPQQGLNYARNRGVDCTRGTYFAFIDDDILVDAGWLCAIYTALVGHDADAVGGRIHLPQTVVLPSWIAPEMYGFLGFQDFGDNPFLMDGQQRYPFGGNMAFHRRVVQRIGLFNPRLGRRGAGTTRAEVFKGAETDYFHRLAAAGGRIHYQPLAIVYHRIKPFQLEKRYFRAIHFNAGYQQAYHAESHHGRHVFGMPLFLFPQTLRAASKYLRLLVTVGPDRAFRQQMAVGHFLGMLQGYARRGRVVAS